MRLLEAARRVVAMRLESGAWRGRWANAASRAWQASASPTRPIALPCGVRVVGVAGATLGGSLETPTVLALGRAISAANGAGSVAIVARAHRAAPHRARLVLPLDTVAEVGDEALWLARELAGTGCSVVVAPHRAEAIFFAAQRAPLVVVDGLLAATPTPLALGVLTLDGHHPWGAGRCPPAGDQLASRAALLGACDCVLVGAGPTQSSNVDPPRVQATDPIDVPRTWFSAAESLLGARAPDGRLVEHVELSARRVGVLLGIARPSRVLRALRARGIRPAVVRLASDHASAAELGSRAAGADVDLWLTTGKCATKLGERCAGAPVHVLDHRVVLPPALVAAALGRSFSFDRRGLDSRPQKTASPAPFRASSTTEPAC